MDASFGRWIKRRRKALDLTQQELARRVGCSLSAIFKIEADERRPSRQVAELLAEQLEIPAEQRALFLKVARQEKMVEALEGMPAPSQPSPSPAFHLPAYPSLLVGRSYELAEISRLLLDPHCRLLTLTGPGGIGKTHLALHAAAGMAGPFSGRVVFAGLAPVSGREQSVTAIADALGIVLYGASDRAVQLMAFLRDKELLLLLDNFEHLVADPGCTGLTAEILRAAPGVKVLTTSRQPLGLQAEWVFEVQGLPVPKGSRLEELEASSAFNLFVQKARQASAGFTPGEADLVEIARICQLVEGLPLGIELAAAWLRTLSPAGIAAEIQKSLDFLETSWRDLPERQRSIRATIDYSWKLLSLEEQSVLMKLSAFRGGFSRPAAQAVAGATLPLLASLVANSLIRRTDSGRYDMHELVRQFGWGQLLGDEAGLAQVQQDYSRYYAGLLEARGPGLKGGARMDTVAELLAELANLRQAWNWSLANRQAGELSKAADTLFWLYESRSNCREGVPLYGQAVRVLAGEAPESSPNEEQGRQLALAQALSYQGYFLFRQGQHPQGQAALRSALEILDRLVEQDSLPACAARSNALVFLGAVTASMGDFEQGNRLLQEGLALKQALNDPWGAAFSLRQIALSAQYQGDTARAVGALQESLVLSRGLEDSWSIAASLNQLGLATQAWGDYDQARRDLQEGLELSRALEDRASLAVALDGLGQVSAAQGQFDEAARLLQESASLWAGIGEEGSLAGTLVHLGQAFLGMGDMASAREQIREALRMAVQARITPVLLEALMGEAEIQIREGRLAPALRIASVIATSPSASQAARESAGRMREGLEAQLPEQDARAVEDQAAGLAPEALAREILAARP